VSFLGLSSEPLEPYGIERWPSFTTPTRTVLLGIRSWAKPTTCVFASQILGAGSIWVIWSPKATRGGSSRPPRIGSNLSG